MSVERARVDDRRVDDPPSSGMHLRALRMNRGLSVREVADSCGLTLYSIYYAERTGGRPRDAAGAKRVADFFGVRVTDLWPVERPASS